MHEAAHRLVDPFQRQRKHAVFHEAPHDANFYSQELQTLGNFGRLDFVAGLYAGYEDGLDYSPTAQIQAPGALNYSLNDATVINITKAVFAPIRAAALAASQPA